MNEHNTNHEEQAKNLEQHLKDAAVRHDGRVKPFEDTADALQREATAATASLDATVARTQRGMLMQLAKKQKNTVPETAPTPAVEKEKSTKPVIRAASPWLAWIGGAATVLAVLFAAVFVQDFGKKQSTSQTASSKSVAAIARLVIPEASAADAFTLTAENQDASGADPATAFLVKSAIPVTSEDMRNHVRIVPAAAVNTTPVDVTVDLVSDGQFRVRPVQPLQPGVVYTVALDTAFKKADGELQARDFTWAVQTKNIFRVVSSIPARDASYVPVDTGIEFVMSMANWEDPASKFEIKPPTPGKFEAHGRSLVFLPNKPLTPGQLYTVTLKKGLKLKDSDRVLEQDEVFRFETASRESANSDWRVSLQQPFMTVAPQKEILVPFWADERVAPEITVTGFSVSVDEAKRLMKAEGDIPAFAEITRQRGDAFSNAAKTQTFQFKAEIQRDGYQAFLKLPPVEEGRYVIKVEPKSNIASWFFLQVTKTAAYVISDKDTTVIWAMDTESNHPLQNLDVRDSSQHQAKTDNSGIARLPTATELSATTTQAVIIELGTGDKTSLVRLLGGAFRPWDRWSSTTDDRTMAFFMPDRPLYHPTDKIELYGKAIDRDTKQPAGNITIELQRSGFYDWFSTGKEKVYRSIGVQSDEQGVFRGSFSWNQLQPGYYQLVLKRDGVTVRSRSIEIRDFVKPAYTIEVSPEHKAVFTGEDVKVNVRARFFEGTPVSGLKMTVTAYGAVGTFAPEITTDADGNASFTLPTKIEACADSDSNTYCPATQGIDISLRPTDSEQAEIIGTAAVQVWRAKVNLEAQTKNKNNVAEVTVTARAVDLAKAERDPNSTDVLGEVKRDLTLSGRIVEVTWSRREEGTRYDFIEKKVVPMYSYQQMYHVIAPINVKTNNEGKAVINVPLGDNASYIAIFTTKDEAGNEQREAAYLSRDGYYSGYPSSGNDIGFNVIASEQNKTGYKLGEEVTFEISKGTTRIADTSAPNFLYVKANRGIKDVQVSTSGVYRFNYQDKDIPNVNVRAILFLNGGFLERQSSATFDSETRAVKIELTADKTAYAPGAKAKVHLKATDKQGKPVSNGRAAFTIVDEALYAAANSTGDESPLGDLYLWVNDGILVTVESHAADAAELFRAGGAEMGGGGMGDAVRRNFKDTADFQNVVLNANGEADIEVALPDNLTSWRASAIVLGNELTAGASHIGLPVTKPVFVEAVVPSILLRADKPVLKLRSYGTGLTAGSKVTYNIDAPSLGLKQDFDGIVGTPTYISIDRLSDGNHKIILSVKSDKGNDALEKQIQIVPSRFLRTESVQNDLAPGSTLSGAAESREIDLTILPKTRAQYLDRVQNLSMTWSERVESQVAANVARTLLKEQFAMKEVGETQAVTKYQKSSGGIGMLPYASEDVELSAKLAALAPEQFDRFALGKYFYEILKKPDVTREQQARAVSGLAALGEPMLPELHQLAEQKNLAWREQLALARAAVAIGDQDTAKAMLAPFFARMEEHDGQSFIRVSEDKREQIEATAEMAVIAAKLNMPQAARLDAWLGANWADDAFTDIDRIAYLQTVVPAALGRDVRLTYTLGSGEIELKLAQGQAQSLTLTAEEVKNFRVVSIDGPAVGVYSRLVATPAGVSSKDIGLQRTVTTDNKKALNDLKEGESVTVTLQPTFGASAPSGCYLLRDHVAAGLAPLVNLSFAEYKEVGSWYPQDIDGNAVTFTVCNTQTSKVPDPITYTLRVIARGTYQVEPAILQSYNTPSVSVTTPAATIEIK